MTGLFNHPPQRPVALADPAVIALQKSRDVSVRNREFGAQIVKTGMVNEQQVHEFKMPFPTPAHVFPGVDQVFSQLSRTASGSIVGLDLPVCGRQQIDLLLPDLLEILDETR